MDKIVVLDFGSQYNQLIVRRIRDIGVYSELLDHETDIEILRNDSSIKGIVLSGGPNSVYEEGAFDIDPEIFNLGLPVLGICYGMQLMAARLGGKVEGNQVSEYGLTKLRVTQANPLTDGFEKDFSVWMSHGNSVAGMPDGLEVTAS